MTDSTYDYMFQCQALQDLVPGQDILVTAWHGKEAVSRPYRFDITVAVRGADLALEKLLDQPATLRIRLPDGSTRQWHGIVTEGAQHGHDESYDYYQMTLEPRLARLSLRQWTDIYLDQQLDDLIAAMLKEGRLTEKYHSDDAPYDYRIMVPDQDLAAMSRPFTCQFDETCLDFLMRKLEFYGVYFWFEQGDDREAIVFGNEAGQQPSQVDSAIYYPKGALDPDIRHVVVTRMDKRVAMRPGTVSLRSLHDQGNTRLTMYSTATVPSSQASEGEIQTVADQFSVLDSTSNGNGNGVSGDTLASWRAQEVACQGLIVQGEARTPGILAGHFVAVSEFQVQADATQYYVTQVEHEGVQTLETSPGSDAPPYVARFTTLPRWRDQTSQADPIQFRPQRATPVPRVSRLMAGFVDMDAQSGPKRYAQPDDEGRYKVRLPFARSNHGGYRNSAWLRLSTPFSAGAPQDGLKAAGMHFPLREGTEVLIAFLNGDPDFPVIVGSLPNAEAPSVVKQANAREHAIRTPGGSGLVIVDGGASASVEDGGDEGSSDSQVENDSQITLYTPNTNAMLNLGAKPEDEEDAEDGFLLRSDTNGEIFAGEYLLIEVPNHYRVCAGGGGTLNNFLGSEATLAPGVSAGTSAGVVFENFIGAKFESAESSTMSLTVGQATDVFAGLKSEGIFALGMSVSWTGMWDFDLGGRKKVWSSQACTGKSVKETLLNLWHTSVESKTQTLNYSVEAFTDYKISSPDINLSAVTSELSLNPAEIALSSAGAITASSLTASISGTTSATVSSGAASLLLEPASAILASPTVGIVGSGTATMDGGLIQIG